MSANAVKTSSFKWAYLSAITTEQCLRISSSFLNGPGG